MTASATSERSAAQRTEEEAAARRDSLLGIAAVVAATALWSTTGAITKAVEVPSLVISFYRLVVSIPVLLVIVKATKKRVFSGPWKWAIVGGAIFGVHQLCWFGSLKMTTIANVTLIGALQPALVALVSAPLFGERVSRMQVLWIAAAIAGVTLTVVGSLGTPSQNGWGDLLALANIIVFTAYFLVSKKAREEMDVLRYNLIMTTVAAIFITVICLVTRQPLIQTGASDLAALLFVALLPGTFGHLFVNWAHPRVTAATSSTILLGVPVGSIALGVVFVDEVLTPLSIAGCAIALASIWAMIHSEQKIKRDFDELELEASAI